MIPRVGANHSPLARAARAPPRGSPTILVIDEALPVQATLLEILNKLNVPYDETAVATSADDALAYFGGAAPRLVFAELIGVHPEEGLDLVHTMLTRAPTCKVVLVTAEPRDSPEVRAALRAGIFAVVEKPLRLEKIRQVLSELETEEGGIERMR